jgi:acetyl esterase/lipase
VRTPIALLLALSLSPELAFCPAAQQQDKPPAAAGTAKSPASASGEVTTEPDVVYGTVNGQDLHLDVYEPALRGAETRAAVVLIHGGGWTSFDKSTMRSMGELLARSGFVAFAIDYRLFKDDAGNIENPWPAQLDDAQRAVRWVRANSAKYSVNGERIGAFGHSAGAQLAALLGMEDTRDNSDPALAKYSSRVQAVVDVSGPADFTTDHDSDGAEFLTQFLAADYAKHPEVWREASPVFHASKGNAPFLIVHGTQDENVPISQARELSEKLQSAGASVQFIEVDDGHTFKTMDARRQLAVETIAFFNRYLVKQQP